MSAPLILITGATGFIGIKTLHLALKAGYSVRAAVRSSAKADTILATPTVVALSPGSRLSFTVIPDILAEGAYDEAVKGVKYILHLASPLAKGHTEDQYESELVQPAIRGTIGILESANKVTGVERIVITSSEVAVIPWEDFIIKEVDTVFDDQYEVAIPQGPYHHPFEAYAASKVRALAATKEFVATKKPEFDVINIMPAFVIGDNELVTDAERLVDGTNSAALSQVLGKESPFGVVPSTSVHVEDVARMHVLSLDPKIPGGQSFLAVSEGERGTRWEEAKEIVKRSFPEAVAEGVLPNNGKAATKRTKVDASRTEKVFGFKFLTYEEQVKTLVGQYLSLVAAKA